MVALSRVARLLIWLVVLRDHPHRRQPLIPEPETIHGLATLKWLIIPAISPTGKDLEDATTDVDRGTTLTDTTNGVNEDYDNGDDDDNSDNPDTDRDSSSNEGGSSDNKTSLVPFP